MRRVLLLCCVLGLVGADPGPADTPRPNVILVSLDTTRADALSCYGDVPGLLRDRGVVTPHLDALAADGARFERFYAHAPTTLSSHATMWTGQDPHAHAIPRNGFPLRPGTPTLAGRLAEAGWDTIAVVSAAALERAMGLDAGFRVYDDRFSVKRGPQFQDPADGVVDRAFAAVDARTGQRPLFLVVHFFDAHQPLTPPDRIAARFVDPAYAGEARPVGFGPLRTALQKGRADPADVDHVAALYLAEVAFVDEQVGRLLDGLRARGLLDHAVVIVTADHGETMSEDPRFAYTHGSDVLDGSTRVPLIVRGFGVPLAERAVVGRQAEMAGLPSTIEVLAGLPPTLGTPFADLVRPGPVDDADGWPRPTRTVLQEATRPYEDEGTAWNNLDLMRGVRAGGAFLTSNPRMGDAPEVLVGSPALEPVLDGIRARWDANAPPFRAEEMADETVRALEALGYVE